jgi:hypothetical protein
LHLHPCEFFPPPLLLAIAHLSPSLHRPQMQVGRSL